MKPPFVDIETALNSFRENKFLIVMDHESRENEGDIICAAANITTEQMAFLIRHSSGYVCTPMSNAIADKLDLPLMSDLKCKAYDDDRYGTAYTITCDYAHGTTTGISAKDRALTCNKLADPGVSAVDFLKPGHVVPLRAKDGGVLDRDGHTEAAVELCKLVGLPEVGVICELVRDEDGLMMGLDDCKEFGKKYGIEMITIPQLQAYVRERQKNNTNA
ncbi:HBL381Cp [Eremothecium sinecaudum]|uniref:3,4-dihydroxy-2-butanone 4-phosphate synthase n=1 Tax=Eremothecium sinecaudum TaxID=45286 RepID=A0A109UVV0_9SACH|nr:HBL381Cp [Eremothecium sinecaudum]AMD18521.1 HBL381Cp [Eremothecium sinecaudum]